jgi:type IV pilus assembly protein PilM
MATTIGLDIGSSAVRAVEVATGGRGPATLNRVGQVSLPPGAVRDGEIVDTETVADAVRTLWRRHGFKGRRVALGVANQQVVVRQVDLPYLPEDELRASLAFTAQDYIPFPVDQALLDFQVLEHFETEDGQRFSRVLLVAAQKDMVNEVVGVARRAKLEPVLLDLDAFAMVRSLAPESALADGEGELLIDVGADITNIVVQEGGVPRFVRILLMGGGGITEGLMTTLGMDYDEAERVKTAGAQDASPQSGRVVAERADRFVEEIRGSLDYYRAQTESVSVRGVVITGGGSQLTNLQERLGEALRLPIERGHPMQQLRIGDVGLDPDQLVEAEPYLSVAIGLALGAAA